MWFPWTLQTYAAIIEREKHPSFIAGCTTKFSDEAELSRVSESALKCQTFPDYLASGDAWRWYGLSSFVVHRALISRVGGFASASINGEDADLALRIGDAPGFIQVESPVTYAYREHEGGVRHQLLKNVQGQMYQLDQEKNGRYPGGAARAVERWRIMSPHMRSCSIACLTNGLRKQAWEFYQRTWRWHVTLGRWKYLAAFPVFAAWTKGRSDQTTPREA